MRRSRCGLPRSCFLERAAGLGLCLLFWMGWAVTEDAFAQDSPVSEPEVSPAPDAAAPAAPAPDSPTPDSQPAVTAKEAQAQRIIAEAAGGQDQPVGPGLKKVSGRKSESGRRNAARRARVRDRAAEADTGPQDDGARAQAGGAAVAIPPWGPYPGYGGYAPWGWYPWYVAPQTYYPYSQYPPSITHVPRLGLQYNYPFALQMGIRVPDDSSPLDSPPNLGPFVGIVQAAKEQIAAEEAQAAEMAAAQGPPPRPSAVTRRAVGLMKDGQFVEAGRVLAAAFEAADDPRYPLLLTEVFFALGKSDRAETILRYALRSPSALKAIPRDVKGHFPPAMDLEARVQELVTTSAQPLLAAYLLAQTSPDRGIDLLGKLTAKRADDDAAALLYRHFLGKTFDAGGSGGSGEPGGSKDSR